MEEERGRHSGRPKGGRVTMPFIFANEVCEKLAVVGFNANMISYLTTQLHLPLNKAANTPSNFGGTASLTPLLGAFLADAYASRFWTITIASIIYQIGMTSLTVSAILPSLMPPPCKVDHQICQEPDTGQLAILYVSLLLGALGAGGYRPCIVACGADQFDETDPKQSNKTWKYCNWYYFVMGASILVAVTVLVYVQDNVGRGWGLGIPTVAMLLSLVAFIVGYPLYRNLDPVGSPFTRLIQVLVAAFRKRNVPMVSHPKLLYQDDELDAPISLVGRLIHTKQMKFLDKAAIVTEADNMKQGHTNAPNLWRLSTVHRVEELKSLIRMGPIWASGILLITIALYDRVFVQVARRFTGLERGITFLHRMGIGFVISILATLVAGFAEIRRKSVRFYQLYIASAHGLTDSHQTIPISFLWLAPQYCLHGIAEAFMSIGHLEIFYDQAPESMRSTAMPLFWLVIAVGNYLSSLLVTLVHKFSAGPGGSNWLPDDNLNKGMLEYFYWLITLLQVANLVYFLFCAKFYTFKPLQIHSRETDQTGDSAKDVVELVNKV